MRNGESNDNTLALLVLIDVAIDECIMQKMTTSEE